MKFWVPWAIDAVVAMVVLFFFITGVADGSVSSFNIIYWVLLLPAVGGFVGGGLWLKRRGKERAAIALLWVLAVPGVIAVLFVLLAIVLSPRWN